MSKDLPFATLLSKKERFYSGSGSRIHDIYEARIDERGHKVLEKTGEEDIYEPIQSYYEETKIENILARCAAGDTEALNQRQGVYADITNMPKNLMEAQNLIIKISNEFDKLDPETRAKFDNSKERFVALFGSDEFNEIMGFKIENPIVTENQTFDGQKVEDPLTPEVGNE